MADPSSIRILARASAVQNRSGEQLLGTVAIFYALLFGGIRMQRLKVVLSLRPVATEQPLGP